MEFNNLFTYLLCYVPMVRILPINAGVTFIVSVSNEILSNDNKLIIITIILFSCT